LRLNLFGYQLSCYKPDGRPQPVDVASSVPLRNCAAEYHRLRKLWSDFPRRKDATVEFLNYRIDVVDVASFLAQFKEIFVDEQYRFQTTNSAPIIIDCGANIGVSCLYFKSNYPNSTILAIEADAHIASVLSKNLASNDVQDVEIIGKAAWIDNDGVSFAPDGADGGAIQNAATTSRVPSVRLRSLLESQNYIDLLKIDIEGAEYRVLVDVADQLHKVSNLFFEYHSWNGEEQRLDELLSIIRTHGYRYHITHITPHKMPFVNHGISDAMDLQLNVFAYRGK